MGRLLYVTGPARSGKSRWAVGRAAEWGPEVVFVATCRPSGDPEMDDRIRRHREQRPAWRTLEAPGSVSAALAGLQPPPTGVVLDCLTLWMTDRLGWTDQDILAGWDHELLALRGAPWPAVVVANEVGWAPVPDSALLRRFRDLAGWLGQRTAAAVDEAWLLIAGCPLRFK
jgi:adenosylcobinamide kinase / adenosylcobinamide-phosphate guanylyltransferase